MSFNLIDFVKSLLPSINKSDLEADFDLSLESLSTITDTYISLNEVNKVTKFNNKENQELIKTFYKEVEKAKLKTKLSTNKNFPGDILLLVNNLGINGKVLKKEVEDISNEVIITQAISSVKSNVVRAVSHYYFMTKYLLDFANYIYIGEAEQAGLEFEKDGVLNKKQIESIEKNMWIFARLIAVYGNEPKSFLDNLKAIEDIGILKEDDVDYTHKIDLFNNLPDGFIGSPIYSIRLVFAQWEADRYKQLKDKKKLLELRQLHLRVLKESGKSDASVEKEMTYLQKRITDIDYKITKIEDSVNDQ